MQVERSSPWRSRAGGYIVEANDLVVGDRLQGSGGMWWPIIAIDESPKTRVVHCQLGEHTPRQTQRLRRTTLIARGPREDER